MRSNVLLVPVALFLTSCIFLAWLQQGKTARTRDPDGAGGRCGTDPSRTLSERYSASIEPFAKVDLAFKSGGIVDGILQVRGADGRIRDVQAGDKVRKGAALAQVRPLDYQNSVDQSEAQRAQAEAQLAQAQAQLAQARANFGHADIDFTRASNLFQSASMVKPQYDQAKAQYDEAAASVAAAEAAVKTAEAWRRQRARCSQRSEALTQRHHAARSIRRLDLGTKRRSRESGGQLDSRLQHRGYASGQSGLCGARYHAFERSGWGRNNP